MSEIQAIDEQIRLQKRIEQLEAKLKECKALNPLGIRIVTTYPEGMEPPENNDE